MNPEAVKNNSSSEIKPSQMPTELVIRSPNGLMSAAVNPFVAPSSSTRNGFVENWLNATLNGTATDFSENEVSVLEF